VRDWRGGKKRGRGDAAGYRVKPEGGTTVKVSTYKNTTMPHLFNAEKVPTSFAATAFFARVYERVAEISLTHTVPRLRAGLFMQHCLTRAISLAHRSLRGRKRFNKIVGFVASVVSLRLTQHPVRGRSIIPLLRSCRLLGQRARGP